MASPQHSKRKERPCDACRKRKSRCVLEEDSTICVLCRFHGQECTFIRDPQSRKRKLPQDGEGGEPFKRRLSSTSVKSKISPGIQTRVIRTTSGTGVEEYDDLDGPSLLKQTLGLQNTKHSQYVGATRGLEPALLGQNATSRSTEFQLECGALRRISSTEAFLLLPDPGTQNYVDELADLDAIETIIQPHGKALVDLYFRIVFPSFPIVHKEVYLEKYNRSYREFSPPLLAAVYLLALQYWSYDDKLSRLNKPDVPRLEKLARKALSDTIHRPKLSTVQAGLLLLQHTDTDSAELTSQLVSVAYGLGLHLDASLWNIPDWEKGLRKRLGWGLYCQDKWSSLGSGRPALISPDNWALEGVTNEDFPETIEYDEEGSAEVEKGRILFTHFISLSQILAELLDTVFTVKATKDIADAGANGVSLVLEKVKPVQLKLKDWFSKLPDSLSMGVTEVMKLNSVGYLRLAYIAVEITLHRRILLTLLPSTDPQLIRICRSVAHERFMFAIGFAQALKPQHLSSFWYFASPQNFALIGVLGTLLLSTTNTPEEADFYKTKLKEYRWTLKINSENGARYMKPAMASLDANLSLLTEAINLQSALMQGKLLELPGVDGGSVSSDEHVAYTGAQAGSGDFSSPGQYAYDASFYQSRNSDFTSPDFPATNSDSQPQDFAYGTWTPYPP